MDDTETSLRHAQCDCGNLRYLVRGDPVHVHACTCTQCQRSSGSVMSYTAWFPEDAVDITGPYTVHYHSGPDCTERYRGFCPTCGTGRFFKSGPSFPNTIALTAGSFAQPGFPVPEFILYWADRPHWLAAPVDVTLYAEGDD